LITSPPFALFATKRAYGNLDQRRVCRLAGIIRAPGCGGVSQRDGQASSSTWGGRVSTEEVSVAVRCTNFESCCGCARRAAVFSIWPRSFFWHNPSKNCRRPIEWVNKGAKESGPRIRSIRVWWLSKVREPEGERQQIVTGRPTARRNENC